MNDKNSKKKPSPDEVTGVTVVHNADGSESYETHTPDSYDEHLVPAETAARQEREGTNFKHVPKYSTGSEHLESSRGLVVDKEGLMDSFAIEPEMYYETRGDIPSHESEVREEKVHQEELQEEDLHQETVHKRDIHQE